MESTTMPWLAPVTLQSRRVNLEPLDQRHCNDLVEAVKDGALWTLWYTSVPFPEGMQAEIERPLAWTAARSVRHEFATSPRSRTTWSIERSERHRLMARPACPAPTTTAAVRMGLRPEYRRVT